MSSFLVKSVVSFQKHGSSWGESTLYGENDIPADVLHRHVDETLKNEKPLILPIESLYPQINNRQYYSFIYPLANKRTSIAIMVFLRDFAPEDFLSQIAAIIRSAYSIDAVPGTDDKNTLPNSKPGNKVGRKMGSLEESLRLWISSYESEQDGSLYDFLISEVDKILLPIVLEKFNSNKSKAARILGINRNTLRKKMAKIGIT